MRIRLALLAALVAAPALAAEPDAPVATAPTTPASASTAEQIDAFIKSAPMPDARGDDAPDGVVGGVAGDARKPHGEVAVSVGTGGYRSIYGRTDIPVGKDGHVSLAFQDSRNAYGYGRGWHGGGPLGFGGADRQRCDPEAMSPARPLDAVGGPHGRCVRPLSDW